MIRTRQPFPAGRRIGCLMLLMLAALANPSAARAQAGFVDPSFLNNLSGPNSWVWALALQPDGRLLVAGQFTSFNGVSGGEVARLSADGQVDTSFNASVTAGEPTIHSVAVQPDGRVLIGGMFTGINGATCLRLARLNADGTLDSNFVASVNSSQSFITVSHLGLQTNSQIVIGGWFESVNGAPHTNIARLNSNGRLDSGYNAQIDTPPNALLLQTDGKVLIGGGFTNVNGVTRNRIARLNLDGTLDAKFQNGMAGADNYVGCVGYDPAGRVLLGGQFANVNGAARNWVARLNSDGSLDTNFVATVDNYLELLLVQPDSRVIIEGSYISTVNGRSRNRVARVQASRAPVISQPRLAGGIFAFDVNAVSGQAYGVEASTNLPGNWSLILSTNAAVDNFTFSDPNPAGFPRRFFRVYR